MAALTRRQKQVLDFVEVHDREHGIAPSLEEIAAHLGLSSVSNAHQHVEALIRRGFLRRDPNRSRALEVIRSQSEGRALPLLGYVAAGAPIEAVEDRATFDFGVEVLARGDHVLRVRGDSLLAHQLCDGDYLVIRTQATAAEGQVVVATVSGSGTTIARLTHPTPGRVRLDVIPAVELDASEVLILGVVTGVVRVL
ncbi:MAG TPA: transcriptional repressor LexA [Longimicrobium sp.]|jgi:repressor LexA